MIVYVNSSRLSWQSTLLRDTLNNSNLLAFLHKCDTMNLLNPNSYGFFRFILLRGGAQRPAGQKNLLEIWYTGRFWQFKSNSKFSCQ